MEYTAKGINASNMLAKLKAIQILVIFGKKVRAL